MNARQAERIVKLQALAMVAASFIGSVAFLVYDQSGQFGGYDHTYLNNLVSVHARAHHMEGQIPLPGYGSTHTIFVRLAFLATEVFGFKVLSALSAPLFGAVLAVVFGALLARKLSDGAALAPWIAASAVALTPFVFGLSRKFAPESLIVGFFAGLAYFAACYQERPSARCVLGAGIFMILGLATPSDASLTLLFAFFSLIVIGLVFLERIVSKILRVRDAAKHFLVLFAVVYAGLSFWHGLATPDHYTREAQRLANYYRNRGWIGVRNFAFSVAETDFKLAGMYLSSATKYVEKESGASFQSQGVVGGLPSYLADAVFNTLRPAGAAVFLGLFVVFIRSNRDWKSRVWALAPILGIGAMMLIPKKNTWYVLEPLFFLPVLAGVAAAQALKKIPPRSMAVWAAVGHLALLGPYIHSTLDGGRFDAAAQWLTRNNTKPVVSAFQRHSPDGLEENVRIFANRYNDFFPGKTEVRLGLAARPGSEMGSVPFYLVASGKPFRITPANTPDAPRLGEGLDAVLFIPSKHEGDKANILDNERRLVETYFIGRFSGQPVRFEEAKPLLDSWKAGRAITPVDDFRLFLPAVSGAAEESPADHP